MMFGDAGLQPTPFVPAKAGTQFFLDSRFRGNERSNSNAAPQSNPPAMLSRSREAR